MTADAPRTTWRATPRTPAWHREQQTLMVDEYEASLDARERGDAAAADTFLQRSANIAAVLSVLPGPPGPR